jgi:hypothetical protein
VEGFNGTAEIPNLKFEKFSFRLLNTATSSRKSRRLETPPSPK